LSIFLFLVKTHNTPSSFKTKSLGKLRNLDLFVGSKLNISSVKLTQQGKMHISHYFPEEGSRTIFQIDVCY